ncbi:MAG TPA: hypothetical protein VGA37_00650 [Gemmatimonadales bacterium]
MFAKGGRYAIGLLLGCVGACGETTGPVQIDSQAVANQVTAAIVSATFLVAPYSQGDKTWVDLRVDGAGSGFAVVGGTFTKTQLQQVGDPVAHKYDAAVEFSDFCDNCETRPRLSGTVGLSGTTTAHTGSSIPFTGSWLLTASIRLAGAFTGSVVLELEVSQLGAGWLGQLEVDGGSWTVFGP